MKGWLVNLDSKHKMIVCGATLLAVFALLYFGIIAPQQEQIVALSTQCNMVQQRIKSIEMYAQKYPDPAKQVRDMEAKIAKLNAMLPNKSEIGDFLKEVEHAAKVSQVSLLEIKPLVAVNRNGYREIPIEIQMKASFTNLLEFMKKLSEIQRFYSISHISIQEKQGSLDVKLIVAIYSYGVAADPVSNQQSQLSKLEIT